MNKFVSSFFYIVIAILNIGCGNDPNSTNNSSNIELIGTSPQSNSESYQAQSTLIDSKKQEIINKLKERARRDWPNDYTTQEYWVNQEIEDYEYMLSIEDNPIKRQAERDWPLDFTTQKYWYNEQIEARERMK